MPIRDPFEVLGVDSSVTQSELYEAYKRERGKYADKRFLPGAEGEEACERLDEIEAAYREADEILKTRFYVSNFDNSHKEIDDLIRQGRIDEAQQKLDESMTRDAEWHFLQSMVFYRRKWYNDAREHLRAAVEKEPNNVKYTDALKNFDEKMKRESGAASRTQAYRPDGGGERPYRNDNYVGGGNSNACTPCNVCSTLLCADCCCECMGGDLISCC
ncbi:MAG TPA: hypothetical protein PLS05_01240 [Clostridia bacterium]|nr:hypothetical protein [Clostridia bacterium]HOL60489.1 hypothetical protein [Clostridia bacterium]